MNKEKLLELINKEVDGSILNREKKNLMQYLESHPDASAMYHEIKDAVETLDRAQELEPAEGILNNVMTQINTDKYIPKKSLIWKLDFLFAPRYRMAYAFVGGIILGAVLLGFFQISVQPDARTVSGTMAAVTGTVAELPIQTEQASGQVEITRTKDRFRLEMIFQSSDIYEIAIGFNQENTEFVSLTPIQPLKTVVERVDDQIRFSGFKDAHYVVLFDKITEQTDFLDIMIMVSQETVINKKIILE